MISAAISRILILVFGILYPAYSSYKAIRTKNVKEYVRWMMHWIVMACFQLIETFSDVFLCWFPFYYETKVCIVFWLLSPMTKGSSILYKKFIHPKLSRHEQDIDDYINQAKTKGYTTVIQLGTKSFDYASKFIVETAIKASGSMIPQIQQQRQLNSKYNRDVVDYAVHSPEEPIDETFADDNEYIDQQQQDVFMHENNANIEFSDIEEPIARTTRTTRSQSRAKENSIPPPPMTMEELSKPIKRNRKKVTEKVRRRKAVHEQIISDDDED
ncbi:hypothetical protein PVAND_004002 [Polypedilum vanderplanki]|uniref:Receptor expression-enhancing protein n=1 Tax=Polypedilum vanderplanki TaxID=319348 RepID=A0A9J6BVR2_POLVA|nr:hypothetical protein PVAND_004002 [Polypedilum vanderplanki]